MGISAPGVGGGAKTKKHSVKRQMRDVKCAFKSFFLCLRPAGFPTGVHRSHQGHLEFGRTPGVLRHPAGSWCRPGVVLAPVVSLRQ